MQRRTISIFLVAAFCAAAAAEELATQIPEEDPIPVPRSSTPKPTLLAIVLPSLDPVESVDNSLSEADYEDEDDVDEDGEMLKTARNIVFRPLFTYRQKKLAKRRAQVSRNSARRSSARRTAQKRNAQPAKKYYTRNYYRPRYPSYYPSYYYNAQFPTIA